MKNKAKKSVITVLVAVCMALCSINPVMAYEDIDGSFANRAAELMMGLGVMSAKSETEFGAAEHVKRGEFAVYAMKFMGYDIAVSEAKSKYFSDVNRGSEEGAAVEQLADMNIIAAEEEVFHINDEITYAEAARILLNCLGYKSVADLAGGYPGGYIKAATNAELNKNVKTATNAVMTKSQTAILFYNAMFVETLKPNIAGVYEGSGKSFMEERMDLYEIKGIVTGVGSTYLGNKMLGDNNVEINGMVLDTGDISIRDYVGKYVRAFYKDDGEDRVLIALTDLDTYNKITTVSADDLEVKGDSVKYYSKDAAKNLKVSPSAAVIYNGKYFSDYKDLEEALSIKEGVVTFISNDGDATADVCVVHAYEHMLVERINKTKNTIYIKNGVSSPKEGQLKDVQEFEIDKNDVFIYFNGTQLNFEDLQENDVLSVERSKDGEYTVIEVARKTVKGKIEKRFAKDNAIEIGGVKYDVSSYADENDILVGTEGTFALTSDAKIIGMVSMDDSDSKYAYVINTSVDESEALAYIKLFNDNGEIVTYTSDDKININGKKVDSSEISSYITKSDFVTYRVNKNNQLTEIGKPYDSTSNPDFHSSMFTKNWNKSAVKYTEGIMGRTFITEDTTIFYIPRFAENNDYSNYRVMKAEDLSNRNYSDVTCYDEDDNGIAGAVVIVEDITASVEMNRPLFFVKDTASAVNEDGENVYQITGYEAGEEKTLNFDSSTKSVTYEDGWMNYSGNEDFDTGYLNLNCGDAIQYAVDMNGDVSAYRLVYNNEQSIYKGGELTYNDPAYYFEDWSKTGAVTKSDFADNLYIALGSVELRYKNHMAILALNAQERLLYDNNTKIDYYRPMNLTNAHVYLYNVNKKALELGSLDDIERYDTAFVRSKNMGDINEVMLYVEEF